MKMFLRRNQTFRQTALLAALTLLAMGPSASANGSFGGDTIGTHPDTGFETRPVLFLEGPRALLLGDVPAYQTEGTGQVLQLPMSDPADVRLEFAPELTVRIDMERLEDPRVNVGFHVAPAGGVTKVRWDLGTHHSNCQTLAQDASIELPVTRLRRAGVLEQGLGFSAFHQAIGRTHYAISADDTVLRVRLD